MKTSFTISENELRAARLFCSNDETRFVINSILFEVSNNRILIVSTDGRRILALCCKCQAFEQVESVVKFAINKSVVDMLLTHRGFVDFNEDEDGEDIITENPIGFVFTLAVSDAGEIAVEIATPYGSVVATEKNGGLMAGKYPDWRKVCRETPEAKPAGRISLNPDLLLDFKRAAKYLNRDANGVSLVFHDDVNAIEIFSEKLPEFYGLLMPMKLLVQNEQKQPSFVSEP